MLSFYVARRTAKLHVVREMLIRQNEIAGPRRSWIQYVLAWFIVLLIAMIGFFLLIDVADDQLRLERNNVGTFSVHRSGFWLTLLFPVAFVFILIASLFVFILSALRRVARCRKGFCYECSYDLTGLTEQRCPECGMPFKKTLPADPDERPASYSSK